MIMECMNLQCSMSRCNKNTCDIKKCYCIDFKPKLKEISSKELNPEYNKLVNDNFWSLI